MDIDQNNLEQGKLDNDEMSLKELIFKIKSWLFFLKKKWMLILAASIIGGFIGLSIVWNAKPTFKATLTFAMEEDKGGSGSGGLSGALGIASSFGIDLGSAGGAFAPTNLTELMKSRLIIEKVMMSPVNIKGKVISLAEYYIEINQIKQAWKNKPSLKNVQFLPGTDPLNFNFQQDSIFHQIHQSLIDKDKLSIMQKDKKISILSIDVVSSDELFSKLFCETIAKETSDFYIQTKSKKARINADVLQRQVDSVRNELNSAITNVAVEADNLYNLNPALNIKSANSKKKQIDVQSNTSILTNLVVQLELAKITLRKETPLIQIIDRPVLPLEKDKSSKLKSLIIGSILAGILSIFYLTISQIYKKTLSQ